MSCTNPKPAILISDSSSKTGQKIKFIHWMDCDGDYIRLREKYGDSYIEIPCGYCLNCIEKRTKAWAIRCSLEAGNYEKNCFVTLTYNPSFVPKDGVSKKDAQRFIKNLRNKFGSGIRYFLAAEYGEKFDRPHYHSILFNFFPDDAKPVKYDYLTGSIYYSSKSLQEIWSVKCKDGKKRSLGFVSVGEVTYNSCAYVARYCQKKIKDMGIIGKNSEFCLMSKKPGLGEKYFQDHFKSLMETDSIYCHIGDKFKFSSFRYFDKLIERIDPTRLQELKENRIRSGVFNVAEELLKRNIDNMADYLVYQETEIGEKYNRLKRRIA